ncbi:MAG: nitroreductase family protein [Dehalococcoidia bacterium]
MDLEALEQLAATQRAVRAFTDQPVPDDLIARILRVATRAPNARNVQPWHFIVIRDRETKRAIADIQSDMTGQPRGQSAPDRQNWADVPVLIAVCSTLPFGEGRAGDAATAGSIYPAVQNLLLAAHAAGLGTVLTTRWRLNEEKVAPLLDLPADMAVHAVIPMGWPAVKLGKNRRKAVAEVTSREKFGRAW